MTMMRIDPVAESLMQWVQQQIELRRDDYEIARRYYQGDHDTALTDRLKKFIHPRLTFRDNFCDVVVDSLAERLKVIGITTNSDDVTEWAWDLWRKNRMDYSQVVTHTETIMLGDGYLLCDWDEVNQRPRWTHQVSEMIIPHYSEATRQMDWASKKWIQHNRGEDAITRLNIYFPDRVEKYVARGGVWAKFEDEGDEMWPIPWVAPDGSPLGVPIIHFRNRPLGSDFGTSEIMNVISLQDLLNKSLIDLVMILDTQAFPQRYTVNINHGSSTIDIMPGSVTEFHTELESGGQVGQWSAADVNGALNSIETMVQHIAGTSRTPQHLFQVVGGSPSGEALKTAESGLVNKAKQRMVNFGNSWEDCVLFALKLQNAFGTPVTVPDDFHLEVAWDDPETRNEESHLNVLKSKMELGVTKHQIWRELGYSQEEIEQMEEENTSERVADTNIGAEILRNFNNGNL